MHCDPNFVSMSKRAYTFKLNLKSMAMLIEKPISLVSKTCDVFMVIYILFKKEFKILRSECMFQNS